MPPDIEGMTSLKVDNLTYRTTPEDVRRAFNKYGSYCHLSVVIRCNQNYGAVR